MTTTTFDDILYHRMPRDLTFSAMMTTWVSVSDGVVKITTANEHQASYSRDEFVRLYDKIVEAINNQSRLPEA